ncbi:cobyrinate a,c-diamide synthase [Hoyosella sp. G463]|uniref:Hydrogenobyrinate a,c-diamide synthase n=1 Tax=Lolliginicoccus lacisalsi TaxID=2742202 RepID=A0A927JAS8_9ACTN|nr:cobyrinate a,c-diamide synthase [Lolliginicoccus lacisalsi]
MVLAAPASGSGKTTLATGIMGALTDSGARVAPFKVGPDYIDPGYHGLATGRVGRNLDAVLARPELIGPLYQHGSRGCDIAIIEGVMGLFDGRIGSGEPATGSTAHIAALLGAPVVLVVDVRGHSQSLAALLHGFATFDPRVRIAGVILNQVGSERHAEVLREACDRAGMPVLGCVPRLDAATVRSRHLGLVTAREGGAGAIAARDAMVALAREHIDLGAIRVLARASTRDEAWDPSAAIAPALTGPAPASARIAVAAGPAFSFVYAEQDELLRAAGAELVRFDPLTDPLPADSTALILPGGFPEEHAGALAENTVVRAQIRDAIERGMPVHAECAGLVYLARDLDGHEMVGALDLRARFGNRLVLGYRDAIALAPSASFEAGERITGHEFHRTSIDAGPAAATAGHAAWGWRAHDGTAAREGLVHRGVHASYLHTHPVARPAAVARFVQRAAARAGAAA